MWYEKIESSNQNHWLLFLFAFTAGVLACQVLLGFEQSALDESQVPGRFFEPNREIPATSRQLPKPIDNTPRRADSSDVNLGGPSGFGNGKAIGTGIAQLQIPKSSTTTADEGEAKNLSHGTSSSPRLLESSQVIPAQAQPLRPLPNPNENRLVAVTETDIFPANQECVLPTPLDCHLFPQLPGSGYPPVGSQLRKSELVFNGGDQGRRVMVDSSFNIYNLEVEDTIGHFDTLDGERLVAKSNRVAIYAPRFGAVRRVDGLIQSEVRQKAGAVDERTRILLSEANDFSTTTKQHLAVDRYLGSKRASGFIDQNRGIVADNVLPLKGARNYFEPYENLSLIRWGKHSNAESPRLKLMEQAASVWQDNLGVQVSVNGVQPILVNDVYKVQQIERIDSDDRQAVMRVVKVASKMAARPGEEVEFTIRFDNLSGRRIGNVTIVDHLTSKLEYVPDSAECTLEGTFSTENNSAGSLILKWEITDPIPANAGGIIRFRCRVR